MSLLSATLKQIGLPPWSFAASDKRPSHNTPGYHSAEAKAKRKANRDRAVELMTKGAIYTEALASDLGVTFLEARSVLSGLVKSKIAYRLDDGRYVLMEAGNAQA